MSHTFASASHLFHGLYLKKIHFRVDGHVSIVPVSARVEARARPNVLHLPLFVEDKAVHSEVGETDDTLNPRED